MCSIDIRSVLSDKVCTPKDLVLLETLISEFHDKYYTSKIQKLAIHFPLVRIIGTRLYGTELREAFKHQIK